MSTGVYMGEEDKTSDRRELGAAAFGEFLREQRKAAGLSITQMASKLGISRPYLGKLERGAIKHPAPIMLSKIAKRLDMHLEDLYALAGLTLPTDLPDFAPYLRAKHPDWPTPVITELDNFCDFLKHRYSLK
jgi:transcriptional regulator with XRE-family HTH domain